MDRLLSMEVFVAVIESGSFTAAAEQFQISPPMVGKHVKSLEQRLGARLLARTTRSQRLTEIGQGYLLHCRQILADIQVAESNIESLRMEPKGALKISSPVTLGSLIIAPILSEYLDAYPEVELELVLSDKRVDLVQEGFDAAIRIGKLMDSSLVARPLCPYPMVICASPEYIQRSGQPNHPRDLTQHQCLGLSHWNKKHGWSLAQDGLQTNPLPKSRFQSNNGQALRMAALKGWGVVMQPKILLNEDIQRGALIEVLQDYWPAPHPVHLVYPVDRQPPLKLTRLVEMLTNKMKG